MSQAQRPGSWAEVASTPDMAASLADRIEALDYIRGIAVLGILFANITAFAHPLLAYYWPGALPGGGSPADQAVWLFQFTFVDGKFRGLFALLFGAGLVLFMERAASRGEGSRLQMRRLFWLLLFGLAHFTLLFAGDILFSYAIAGFLALSMIGWRARTQLRAGLAWYLLTALAITALLGSQAALEASPDIRAQPAMAEQWQAMEAERDRQIAEAGEARQAYGAGGYARLVDYRLREQNGTLTNALFIVLVETVPLMLIGMALHRLGFFRCAFDAARMRLWGWAGLIGGALGSLALGWWALSAGFPFFLTQFAFNAASAFPRLAMILGLAALLVLAAPVAARGWLGQRVIAAGRMAFSNYIGTSVVMMLVFQGWAGGLFGQLGRIEMLGFVLFGWVLMLAWSKPWLARYRFGPLEWLWRCLTYRRKFPLRRKAVDNAIRSH